MSTPTWIDVHTHLNMLDDGAETALKTAAAAGVSQVITIGTTPQDWPVVQELAARFFPRVVCTLGVHPHDAGLWSSPLRTQLIAELKNQQVVAVGEIGLDYYYNNSPPNVQLACFREQMEIAATAQLPVEIHTRDAEEDTAKVIEEFSGRVVGLLHCFTSSWALAERALALGYHISFSGVVTFKNAEALRDVCRRVPLDRLHVETDAPFLSPVPFRGKKNQPALMVHTADVVAGLKGVSLDQLASATRANASRLFPRLPALS